MRSNTERSLIRDLVASSPASYISYLHGVSALLARSITPRHSLVRGRRPADRAGASGQRLPRSPHDQDAAACCKRRGRRLVCHSTPYGCFKV